MQHIILCEGKTDAILISYFLIVKYGWEHNNNKEKSVKLPNIPENETLNWYLRSERATQNLAVWGVGGISEIPTKLEQIVERTRNERNSDNRFNTIVLYFDRDRRNENECLRLTQDWINNCGVNFQGDVILGEWMTCTLTLKKQPVEEHTIRLLAMALPPNSPGNLETYLLHAIQNYSEVDSKIVSKATEFVSSLPDYPYLERPRYRIKASLGSVLSVMSPDWVFSKLDDRLKRIKWEQIISEENVYSRLGEI
jgi:hypothetical protein